MSSSIMMAGPLSQLPRQQTGSRVERPSRGVWEGESARAAAAAILWLYTSKAGESALIDTLDLITPWGTGSNQNAAAAMQAAQGTARILPGAALDKTQPAALQQAQRGLYYEADGITLRDGLWDEDAAAAWRSAVMAALGAESAEADDN